VADIRLDQQWARVESFTCRTLAGTALHVHAARYVLALGGVENTRVLLASRSQQPEGVANGHGVVQALVTRGSAFQAKVLTVRAEQSPLRESRITLTDEVDALGMPRVALDWRIAPEDDVQIRRAMVVLGRDLGAAGIARLWVPGDARRFVWRQDPGGHHMGATRMGRDPAVSVVDATCRTHEVRNLYVAGCSVFTTGADSNPTLTIVALAHRLADTLEPRRRDRRTAP